MSVPTTQLEEPRAGDRQRDRQGDTSGKTSRMRLDVTAHAANANKHSAFHGLVDTHCYVHVWRGQGAVLLKLSTPAVYEGFEFLLPGSQP